MRDDDAAADGDEGEGNDEQHHDLIRDAQTRHGVVADMSDHEGIDDANEDAQALLDKDKPGHSQQRGSRRRAGGWFRVTEFCHRGGNRFAHFGAFTRSSISKEIRPL